MTAEHCGTIRNMNKIKDWLIEMVIKQMGPSAIRNVILFIAGWLTIHSGILDPLGIHYDATKQLMTIDFSTMTTWLSTIGLSAGGAALIKLLNHQSANIILKQAPAETVK